MWRSIIVIILFLIGAIGEIVEIVSFEKGQKQNQKSRHSSSEVPVPANCSLYSRLISESSFFPAT